MKLSIAIRKGAEQHPQCFAGLIQYDQNGKITQTCALGAAFVGMFGLTTIREFYKTLVDDESFFKIYPELDRTAIKKCPILECRKARSPLRRMIEHLNDVHKLPRERIADWVEKIEETYEANS